LTPCTINGQIDTACVQDHVPGFIASLAGKISRILGALRSAAPDAEIIVTGAYDSFVQALAFADPLYQSFNAAIATAAVSHRARFADPFPIFNPQGDLTAEMQAICTLTLLCADGDSHSSDAGYRALARLVFEASGYRRLDERE
jgi:hypothetical protein